MTASARIPLYPVDSRRRFNVDKTSYDDAQRRIDVETRPYVYKSTDMKVPISPIHKLF